MSEYIEFINKVKNKSEREWLTPSQQRAFNIIKKKSSNHRIVNIFGKEGVGKTFLGWILEKEGVSKYFVDSESVEDPNSETITVDNFPPNRSDHRDFRRRMGLMGIRKAILITKPFAIPDDIKKIEIEFDEEDRKQFKSTCTRKLRVQFQDEEENDNMHELLKKNIWS